MNTSIFSSAELIDAKLKEQELCNKINTFLYQNLDVEQYMGLERFNYVQRSNRLEEDITTLMLNEQDKLNGKVVELTEANWYGKRGTIEFHKDRDGRTRYEAGIELWIVFDQEGRIHPNTGKPSACLVPLSNLTFVD